MTKRSNLLLAEIDPAVRTASTQRSTEEDSRVVASSAVKANSAHALNGGLKRVFSKVVLVFLTACLPVLARAQSTAVLPTFKITGLRVQGGRVTVSWQGGGTTNQVQTAPSLTGPWTN